MRILSLFRERAIVAAAVAVAAPLLAKWGVEPAQHGPLVDALLMTAGGVAAVLAAFARSPLDR